MHNEECTMKNAERRASCAVRFRRSPVTRVAPGDRPLQSDRIRRIRGISFCILHSTFCILSFALVGCQSAGPRLPADERAALRSRAEDLLLRACANDIDVVRANAIEALVQVMPDAGRACMREALQSDSPLVRFAAAVGLGELRDNASRGQFQALLADPDPRVRLAAAFAAVRVGDGGRAALLVEALNSHPDENLRADAAYLIGRVGDKRAVRRLRFAARRERSSRVLMHIYTAMASLGDEYGMDRLMEAAVSSDIISRLVALQGLAELGDERSRPALLIRFKADGDYVQSRLIAARGLGRLGSDDGYDLAVRNLRYKDSDENETMRVRSLAALTLGAIGDDRALPLLADLAANEDDPRTQVAACYAICQITRPRR